MTANDRKSYLPYLNKLVDQWNNTYHLIPLLNHLLMPIILFLLKNLETNLKTSKFKVIDRVRITKYKNIFTKGYTENWSTEIFIVNSVLKTNSWTYKLKNWNEEKIIQSF